MIRQLLIDCRRLITGRAGRGNAEAIEVQSRIDTALAEQCTAADEVLRIWFMRDNHTFLHLSLDVEEAILQLRAEEPKWTRYGSVFARTGRDKLIAELHAQGDAEAFIAAVREWYATLPTNPPRPQVNEPPSSLTSGQEKERVTDELVELGAEAIYHAQHDPSRDEEFAVFKRDYPDVMFEYRKESRAVLEAVADQLGAQK